MRPPQGSRKSRRRHSPTLHEEPNFASNPFLRYYIVILWTLPRRTRILRKDELAPLTATPNARTPLYDTHVSLGARMVPFGGWDMPVQYAGTLSEARAARTAAGLFDVSHMGRLYVSGPQAAEFLDWTLTGSAATLRVGRARYCFICNENGGVIDDTIFYRLGGDSFLLIPNAGNRAAVTAWFRRWIDERFPGCRVDDRTEATAFVAFQGPDAARLVDGVFEGNPSSLRPFAALETRFTGRPAYVGRTGYTGEDGFEIVVDAEQAVDLWNALSNLGAAPCGLGARDVLRLEAALPLHGHEIDETTTPVEAGMERFVRFDKEYVGSDVLKRQRENGTERRLAGLTLPGRRAPRAGYPILSDGRAVGRVTSGSYSPSLDISIALGYVEPGCAAIGAALDVDIRGQTARAEVVALPFYTRPGRNP